VLSNDIFEKKSAERRKAKPLPEPFPSQHFALRGLLDSWIRGFFSVVFSNTEFLPI
jgi:hypothetical protein